MNTTQTIVTVVVVLVVIVALGFLIAKFKGSTEDFKIENDESLYKEIVFPKTYSEKKDIEIRFQIYDGYIIIVKLEFASRTPIITRYRFKTVDYEQIKKEDFIDIEQTYYIEVSSKKMEQAYNSNTSYKDKDSNVFAYRFGNILPNKKEQFLNKLLEVEEEIVSAKEKYEQSLLIDKRDKETKIKELDELLKKGSITLEEYNKAKHDILIS